MCVRRHQRVGPGRGVRVARGVAAGPGADDRRGRRSRWRRRPDGCGRLPTLRSGVAVRDGVGWARGGGGGEPVGSHRAAVRRSGGRPGPDPGSGRGRRRRGGDAGLGGRGPRAAGRRRLGARPRPACPPQPDAQRWTARRQPRARGVPRHGGCVASGHGHQDRRRPPDPPATPSRRPGRGRHPLPRPPDHPHRRPPPTPPQRDDRPRRPHRGQRPRLVRRRHAHHR